MITDNATDWRDLADQLTSEQITRLTEMEQQAPADWTAEKTATTLLGGARQYAEQNLTDAVMFGAIAAPADATRTFHWERHDGRWAREFEYTRHRVGPVTVYVDGRQYADGRVQRRIAVASTDDEALTAAQARQLAAQLLNAADLLDGQASSASYSTFTHSIHGVPEAVSGSVSFACQVEGRVF